MTELELKKLVIEAARYHSLPADEVKKRYQEFLERLKKEGGKEDRPEPPDDPPEKDTL